MKRDYYEVLGVGHDVGEREIKSAYRKLAVRYHPDKNPGDAEAEERFKEAAEAYAVLSDADKRARYDRFGHQGVAGAGAGGFDPTVFADFGDILGDIFGFGDLFGGGRRRSRRARAGADLRYDLEITFEEAAFGCETKLRVPRLESCPQCGGTGSEGGKSPSTCNVCGGQGQVRFSQGFLTVARTCPQCQGTGTRITDPCPECRGGGRVERERTIQVEIPAGVDTGARLRLSGEGEHGVHGGPPGDLFVVLRVAPHPRLARDGADVREVVEIGYAQAVLGGEIEVETLHGQQRVHVPPGTEAGDEHRIRGEGVPRLGGRGRGDHVLTLRIEVPALERLDDEQVELLKRLAELEGRSVKGERTVIERVKDLFG